CRFLYVFFNDTATTEIYTLSLHDALPIPAPKADPRIPSRPLEIHTCVCARRSEEHTSELQSRQYLVCRLLLENKKKIAVLPVRAHTREGRLRRREGRMPH